MEGFKKTLISQIVAGSGGGKATASSRTPVEANDTVNSRAMMSILDLLGEGVIGGLKDGAKSIFLNDLPIQNNDGTYNYSGLTWWQRTGTQDQEIIPGFDVIETPKSIARTVKNGSPVALAVDSDESDQLRVILKFTALKTVDKTTGDTTGATVSYLFEVSSNGGAYVGVAPEGESSPTVTLTAKKAGNYYRSYSINLPKPGGKYQVRITRITADAKDSYIVNDFTVDTVGEIVNTNLNYPNSALVGLRVNSEQFGSTMPTRSYLISGMKIQVPSNYNSNDGTYAGTWDGTFTLLASSNPAWILYDLLLNTRYGLGEFVKPSMIDVGQLYQIGRYCDVKVDDGFGGKEKRFAINTQITSRQDAYRVIQDIAGAFRGMVFWSGGGVHVMQDSPSDPIALFSAANVVDGKFTYKGSARKDRPSVALITYNNKEDNYKQNIEYVEDEESVKRYGIRKTESVAFGCTSRGMAHRVGLWTLYTARMESDVITFKAGMDAAFLTPGDTILIQDKYRAGRRNSGRVVSASANSITLDGPVDITHTSTISFLNSEGKIITRDVVQSGTGVQIVTFKTALAEADMPVADGLWTIAQDDLVPVQARITSVAQGDEGQSFEITCVQNNQTKYAAIDDGAALIPQKTTVLDPTYSTPENLTISESTYLSSPGNLSVKLTATWTGKSPEYLVSYRRSDAGNVGNWVSAKVKEEQFELFPVAENGQYDFQVYGVSFTGRKTAVLSATYKVLGTLTPPGAPSALTAQGDYRQILLSWTNANSVDLDHVEIYGGSTNDVSKASLVATSTTTNFTHGGLEDSVTWFYWVRSVNKRGMVSPWNSTLGTSATTKDVLSFLNKKITSSQLGQDLLADIESKAVAKEVDERIDDANTQAQTGIAQAKADATSQVKAAKDAMTQTIQQEVKDRASSVAAEATARANAISAESKNRAMAISDAVTTEANARSKEIADNVKTINASVSKEATDRTNAVTALDTKSSTAISKEASDRAAAVSAEASARADAVLQEKNARVADISTVQTLVQTTKESLAQQISQVAAGTGDQFDSFKIWYFDDNNAAGWTSSAGATVISTDGWIRPATTKDPYLVSPAGLNITSLSYRFLKLRIRKTGSPTWQGEFRWKSKTSSFDNTNIFKFPEPTWDSKGVATITLQDLPWTSIDIIDAIRFDFTDVTTDANFVEIDWIAVGRPTPGAGMADVLSEQTARVAADASEAAQRQTLAVQMRGGYEGSDLSKVTAGLIYQEQQARVTADQAEATERKSLQTKVEGNIADVSKSLDTLTANDKAQASDITNIKTTLGNKADASALSNLSTKVDQQGTTISSQATAITNLQNSLTATNNAVSAKADQSAVSTLQGTVTQQGKDITAANNSITNLKSSIDTTNSKVNTKADATTVNDLTTRVTNNEKSTSSQGDSITSLNNSLTQLARSANPWLDGTFESYTAGSDVNGSGSGVIVVADTKYAGSRAARARRYANESGNSDKMIGPWVGVRAGAKYRVELWALMTSDQSPSSGWNVQFGFNTVNPAGSWGWVGAVGVSENGLGARDKWVKFSGIATLGNDVTTARFWISCRGALGSNTPGYDLFFDNVVITEVTDAQAAQDTANANASAISTMQNTVAQQGNTLSSQSDAINNLKNSLDTTNSNVSKKADASAVSTLANTVKQQGDTLNSASSNITTLQNSVATLNQKEGFAALPSEMDTSSPNMWMRMIYVKVAPYTTEIPDYGITALVADSRAKLIPDAATMSLGGNNCYGLFRTIVNVSADKTITVNNFGGDDAHAVYVDGILVYSRPNNVRNQSLTFDLKAGWHILDLLVNQGTGDSGFWFDATTLISSQVTSMYSPRMVTSELTAQANAISGLTNTTTQQGKDISSQGASITKLSNSLDSTNDNVAKKADASALATLSSQVTKQGETLTSQGSSVTSLQNSLSGLRVGGRNLLPNTGTLKGASVITDTFMGNAVAKSTKAKGDTTPYINVWEVRTINKPTEDTYVLSFYAKSDVDGQRLLSYFYSPNTTTSMVNSQGVSNSNNDGVSTLKLTTSWQRYSIVWKQSATDATKSVIIGRLGKDDSLDQSVYISCPKLEVGNMPTDWTAAPEDVDAQIGATATALTTLTNTVNQQGSALSSQSDSLTNLNNIIANGREDFWQMKLYPKVGQASNMIPDFDTIAGISPTTVKEVADSVKMDFTSSGNYLVAHFQAVGYLSSAKTLSLSGTSRLVDDGGQIFINGQSVATIAGSATSASFDVPAGWSTIDVLIYQHTGNGYFQPNQKISDFFNNFYSGAGLNAASNAITSVRSTVTQQGGLLTSQSTAITSLQNSLNATNNKVNTKADASALSSLQSTVSQQADQLTTQSGSITSLQNSIGQMGDNMDNMIINPSFENDLFMWGVEGGAGVSIVSAGAAIGSKCLKISAAKVATGVSQNIARLKSGRTYRISCQIKFSSDAVISDGSNTKIRLGNASGLLKDYQFGLSDQTKDWTTVTLTHKPATDQLSVNVGFRALLSAGSLMIDDVIMSDITDAVDNQANTSAITDLQSKVTQNGKDIVSTSSAVTSLQNSLNTTNDNVAKKADASALTTLQNTVKSQGDSLSSQSGSITSLQNSLKTTNANVDKKADTTAVTALQNTVNSQGDSISAGATNVTNLTAQLNRRTVFVLTSQGMGATGPGAGITDEAGKKLFSGGRSYSLIVFKRNDDGSTGILSSKVYDVYNDAKVGATLASDIGALANGVYAAIITSDEPSQNKASISAAIELLGGTTEMINSLVYRSAYVLLGRKGMKAGDGLELISPTGAATDSLISTSVEFINGVMSGLGSSGGVMIKSDALAKAADALTSRVTTTEQNITSVSNRTTSLENSVKTANDNISKKADASALTSLNNTVTSQGTSLSSQGNRVTALENNMTTGDNIVPNSQMLNNAQGWGGDATTVDGYPGVKANSGWSPNSPKFSVTPGDIIDFSLMCKADAAINGLGWGVRFDGPNTSNVTAYVGVQNYAAGDKKSVNGSITVPAGATTGYLQPNMSSGIFLTLYNVDVTRRNAGTVANSSAISTLNSTVAQQGNTINSIGTRTTALENNLATTNGNLTKKADASALTTLANRVDKTESSLTTQSSSITSLSNSITAVRKSGANLVMDGGFETSNPTGNLSITTVDNHSGSRCARFTRRAATNSGGNNDVQYSDWFDLRANQVVYVEVWARLDPDNTVDSKDGWANVGMQWQNSAEANNWPSAFQIKFANLTASWQKFSGYVKVGADAYRGIFWMSIPQNASNIQGYSFLLDDVIIMDATEGYNAQQTANAASSAVSDLSSKVTTIDGKVSAQTTQLNTLKSSVDDTSSKLDTLSKTVSDGQSTQASLNTSLQSQISSQASANVKNQTQLNDASTSIASIKSTQSTQSSQISAVAKTQTDLTATVNSQGQTINSQGQAINSQSASIQAIQTAVASKDDLSATWMIKMETRSNGQKYAAGIALGVDGRNMQSQFLVQADRFALINTGNGNTSTPFVIDNGVTYMNAAYIKNGSIDSAKVGDLMSNGFQENVRGWRISRDGTMNINGSAGGTGRLVLSNNRLDVFDDNNVLRVRLGLL